MSAPQMTTPYLGQLTRCTEGTADAAAVSDWMRQQSMGVSLVQLTQPMDCAGGVQTLAQALRFPEYFGMNLDALYDWVGEYADDLHKQVQRGDNVPQLWWLSVSADNAVELEPIAETLLDALSACEQAMLGVVWMAVG